MHDVPAAVDFHFDVMCPWAYRTSIWMREVRDRAGVDVTWRFFSLEEVNREDGKPHPWERPWSYGWSLLRIAARLNRDDHELVDRWYERAGRALHAERTPVHDPDVARTLLAEIGVDPRVLDEALEDPTTHDDVRADHQRVIDAGGWGVPTLFFGDEECFFGPVILDPPVGDEAVELYRLVAAMRRFPTLYELQRPKQPADLDRITEQFASYLETRAWRTIQNETP